MSHPDSAHTATVDGRFLQAVVDGVVQSCGYFEERARTLLAESGLDRQPVVGQDYAFDRFLDVLERIEETTGPNTLDRVGHRVAAELSWNHHVGNVDEALETLDARHESMHSGDTGGYEFERIDDTTGTLRSTTPYPAAFERGLVSGLGERFGHGSGYVNVRQESGPTVDGASAKTFALAWWTDVEKRTETVIPAPTEAPSASDNSARGRPAAGD